MKQVNNDLESKDTVHVTAYERNTCTKESKDCKDQGELCVANTHLYSSYAIRKKTTPMRLFFGLVLLLTVLNDICGGSALLGSFGGIGGSSGSSELSTLITPHITPSALLQLATFHTLEEDAKEKHLNWGSSSVLQIRYDECNKEISRETKQFVRSILSSSSSTEAATAIVISSNMHNCNNVTTSQTTIETPLYSFLQINVQDEDKTVTEGEMQNKPSVNYYRRRPHRRQHRKRKTNNNNNDNNDNTSATMILKENINKMEEKSIASSFDVVAVDATTDETNNNYDLGLSSTTSLSTQVPPPSSFSTVSTPVEHKNINSATQVSTPCSFSYCSSSSISTYNMHLSYFVAQPESTYSIPDFNIWHRIWCQMHIVEVACSTHSNNFIHLTRRFHEYQNMYPVVYHLHLDRFSHPLEEELLTSSSCGLHESRYWNCTQCHYAHSVVRESCIRCGAASHFTKLFVGNLLKDLNVTHVTNNKKGLATTFDERYADDAGQTKEQSVELINENENIANSERTINENIDNYGLRVLLRILYATHPDIVIHRVEEHVKRTTSNSHPNGNYNKANNVDTLQKGHDANNAKCTNLESVELFEINKRSRGCASVYVKNEDAPILIDKLHHNIFINERINTLPCKHATNDLNAHENNGNINDNNNNNNNSNELIAHYVYSSQQE